MVKTLMACNSTGIRRELQKRAPLNSQRVPGPYRRFPGYADDAEEEEKRFFHNTICLIQTGLCGQSIELLTNFLKPIVALHRLVSWECPTILQTFGGPNGVVSAPTAFKQRMGIEAKWAETLMDLSGSYSEHCFPFVISSLLCPESAKQIPHRKRLDKKDLILVLGKKGQFVFAENLSGIVRKFKKQIVIAELGQEDISVHFDLAPDLVQNCQLLHDVRKEL